MQLTIELTSVTQTLVTFKLFVNDSYRGFLTLERDEWNEFDKRMIKAFGIQYILINTIGCKFK